MFPGLKERFIMCWNTNNKKTNRIQSISWRGLNFLKNKSSRNSTLRPHFLDKKFLPAWRGVILKPFSSKRMTGNYFLYTLWYALCCVMCCLGELGIVFGDLVGQECPKQFTQPTHNTTPGKDTWKTPYQHT